jgi:hypothetical protein
LQKTPLVKGKESNSWTELDKEVRQQLNAAGKQIVSTAFASPSIAKLMQDFKHRYPMYGQVTY